MLCSRAWYALMRRNLVYRKRNIIGTILEILLPVGFVGIIVSIKNAIGGEGTTQIAAEISTNSETYTALSFSDYLTAIQAKRICIRNEDFNATPEAITPQDVEEQFGDGILDGIDEALINATIDQYNQYYLDDETSEYRITGWPNLGKDWMIPFVRCDQRECRMDGENAAVQYCEYNIFGIAGDDSGGRIRAQEFITWMQIKYPILNQTNNNNNNNSNKLPFDYDFIQYFDSSSAMNQYVRDPKYGETGMPKMSVGIVFVGNDNKNLKYHIRQNSTNFNAVEQTERPGTTTTPPTDKLFESFAKTDNDPCPPMDGTGDMGKFQNSCTGQYMYNGVLTIQRLVHDYYMDDVVQTRSLGYYIANGGIQYTSFPSKSYEDDGFFATIGTFLPILISLGLLYPVASMIGYIVREKELRQKELMKMMSVTESDIGWSWFCSFMVVNIVSATLSCMMSTLVYERSNSRFLWFFWLLTYMSLTCFVMTLATLTSKASRATLIGLLVFFFGSFLSLIVDYTDGSLQTIQFISLHPAAAFAYGLTEMGRLEDAGVGATSETISNTDNPSGYTAQSSINAMIFDSILFGILSWYFNRVIQPDYGQALPIWFPFQISYWCPGHNNNNPHSPSSSSSTEQHLSGGDESQNNNDGSAALSSVVDNNIPLEPVSPQLERQTDEGTNIVIQNLRKHFGNEKVAVDGLNLTMYNGQITALLGHNGAGKTTTINMLTGALAPSMGTAIIAGKDVRTQKESIRQDIGICLQHDCLFPMLTVREHVQFFARLKGLYKTMSRIEAEQHIDQSIQDVALAEKANTFSKNLSGGMKRKLSVAIAFCGGSKIVLLDEPTSGMDPFSRRFTWNVIRQYRQDRCIILTTHFMDEADILGDRIAIMAEGRLRCAGSSLFLKKTYGVGYQLTIERDHNAHANANNNNGNTVGATPTAPVEPTTTTTSAGGEKENGDDDDDELPVVTNVTIISDEGINTKLKNIVEGSVPESTLLSDVGTELSYQLPLGSSSKFTTMFEGLDDEVDKGTVSSYGVSITTLDEVFLLVARGGGNTPESEKKEYSSSRRGLVVDGGNNNNNNNIDTMMMDKSARSKMNLDDDGLFIRHLGALFRKRAANFKRDKKAWICTTIVPSLFVLLGLIIFRTISIQRNLDPITLDISKYNPNIKEANQNPVSFNSPTQPYQCQPGRCAFDQSTNRLNETNEIYFFCGVQAYLGIEDITCSVNTTIDITNGLSAANQPIQPQEVIVKTIEESSQSLLDTSGNFAATQYAAVFFTHDVGSVFLPAYYDTSNDATIANATQLLQSLPDGTIPDQAELLDQLLTLGVYNGTYNATTKEQCEQYLTEYNVDYTYPTYCEDVGGIGYVIHYNFTAIHVAPTFQALTDEAIIRHALEDDDYNIDVTIAPLPITDTEEKLGESDDAFTVWFLVILSFPFIMGAQASFVVAERESKAKHLQTVAGVKPAAYWLSTYFWDIMNYQIPMWITFILMLAFDVTVFTTKEKNALSGVLATMILYGPASAGFAYCSTFFFKSPSLCNMFLIITGFLIGMGGPLTILILKIIGSDRLNPKQNLLDIADTLGWILRFIPPFNLGAGLFNALNVEIITFIEGKDVDVWTPEVLQNEVIFLAWETVGYLVLAIFLDIGSTNPSIMKIVNTILCRGCCAKKDKDITRVLPDDDDVIGEEERVSKGEANNDLIVMSQLRKVYDNGKVAVSGMSLGIPPGECFGLLGINGAGKTTTMGMLTAEFPPSDGDATLAGYSVVHQPAMTRRRIGYCPQFDAHFANLTGREHVELYAAIKGIPRAAVKEAAAAKLREVGLSDFDSDRVTSGYSGGMRRRLSLACATIGQPQIVFLDECSTGVDPVARREIWELVSDLVSSGSVAEERTSVILTTHSMEECEALCPRIGIMANGRLRCLGSAQHLKSKFGQGYQVELKVQIVDEDEDDDYKNNVATLISSKEGEAGANPHSVYFTLGEAWEALRALSDDNFLSDMVTESNPAGYSIYKDATSPTGVSAGQLGVFATLELRMRDVEQFVSGTYPSNVLRERQDTKARYEVSAVNTRISKIFASIEENKERLRLADYGVSQTSLEQVFNMHAAEAEKLKYGRNDG